MTNEKIAHDLSLLVLSDSSERDSVFLAIEEQQKVNSDDSQTKKYVVAYDFLVHNFLVELNQK